MIIWQFIKNIISGLWDELISHPAILTFLIFTFSLFFILIILFGIEQSAIISLILLPFTLISLAIDYDDINAISISWVHFFITQYKKAKNTVNKK